MSIFASTGLHTAFVGALVGELIGALVEAPVGTPRVGSISRGI